MAMAVGTIAIRFAKYASYCGLVFMNKRHTTKCTKIYTSQKFLYINYDKCFLSSCLQPLTN